MKTLKRLLTLILITTLAVGVRAERVSQEDAAAVANNFMNASASASGVRKAVGNKRMVLKKAAEAEENQFYVYENADGEGWVMVAANDVVKPILAYSETGTFRTDNMPSNVTHWLGHYDKFIKKLEDEGVTQTEEAAAQWKALRKAPPSTAKGNIVVDMLVQTQWDQDAPYNNLCPGSGSSKAYTGCVATAMAQVMNFWQWPVTGNGSRTYQPKDPTSETGATSKRYGQQTADFGSTTYDWANMKKKHYTSDNTAQKTAIATLMFHCGVATDMMYGNSSDGGSATYTVNYGDWDWSDSEGECAQNALYNFFRYKKPTGYMRDGYKYGGTTYYTSWTDAAWTNMIKTELNAGRPIMYGGSGSGGGHSFICDGYDDQDYFHFNWGWSGSNDGWYTLSNLVPGSGGAGGGSYSFTEDQDAIIGIEPVETGHKVVLNGTGCTLSAVSRVENGNSVTVTITPTDATYDYTSASVTLGSSTISYSLNSDKTTLTISGSAITGDASKDLTITVVWTKNRYKYELAGENCMVPADGMVEKNASLNLTITPDAGYTLANAECWDVTMGGSTLTYGTGFTYNSSTGAFVIASVTGDVEILAYGGRQVSWYANGSLHATNMSIDNKITLPSNPADCAGAGGKKFVGWCTISDYSHATTAPTFAKDGDTYSVATYYAVYATPAASSAPRRAKMAESSATYTFTSKSWEATEGDWTSGQDGNGYSNSGVQVTTGASGANATCPTSYSNISSIVVSYCTNSSKGAGTIKMTVDGNDVSQSVSTSGGTTARDLTFDFSGTKPSGAPKITVTCTTNSIYVCGLTINYGGGGSSYIDYSTTCGAPVVCALTGITLNTSGATTTFSTGDTFSSAGLVVTAHYSNCADATVTPTSISSLDMSTAGTKTITVSYTESGTTVTETYTITVSDPATHTVTWSVQGNTSTTTFADGASLVVPSPQPSDCPGTDGKIFVGWTAHSTVDGSEPDDLFLVPGTKTVTADITYYAVYADYDVTSGGGAFDGDTEGYYKIYAEVSGTKYYATGTVSSGKMSGTTNEADATEYTFTKVSGGWTIQNGTTYITYSSNTNLGTSNSSYTWTLSEGSHGTWRVASGTNSSRAWIYRAGSVNKFGGYSTSNVNGTEYFDLEIGGGSSSVITYSDYSLTCTDTPPVPTYTVTYMACGAEFTTQTYPEGAALVLPSSAPEDNAGKSFAGWTATEHYTGASAPTLITAGGAVNADATYYAVFH